MVFIIPTEKIHITSDNCESSSNRKKSLQYNKNVALSDFQPREFHQK